MNKAFIDGKEYNFLRENPALANVAYLVISGSHGYGTNNENSDIDLRGFLVEGKKYLFGSVPFEQFEDVASDTVIYGLKKFFALLRACNPNVIELLGADENCIVFMNEVGRKVRENADIFLSKRAVVSFGGYASDQLRRLSNALCHDQFDREKQERYLCDTLKGQIDHFNRTYTSFGKNSFKIYIDNSSETPEVCADINLKAYPLRDFAGILSEMREAVRTYDKLNHRNRKKDDAHLYKHAMHLIRLLITGTDILSGKGIITKRRHEHDFLMDIRNGKYPFEEIFILADEYRAKFDEAALNTSLPDEPNNSAIENLQIEIFEANS